MYCIKCKKDTGSIDKRSAVSNNGLPMIKAKCKICGKFKSQFIKRQAGGGVLNDTINKLLVELHLRGFSRPWNAIR